MAFAHSTYTARRPSISSLFFPSTYLSLAHRCTTQSPDPKVWKPKWKPSIEKPNRRLIYLFGLATCGILVPRPGIKPVPPAMEACSLNDWTTREIPRLLTPLGSLPCRVSLALANHSTGSSIWSLAWSCPQISLVAGREEPWPRFCGSLFDCNPTAMAQPTSGGGASAAGAGKEP